MSITNEQYLDMLRRTEASKLRDGAVSDDAVEEEGGLHDDILKWCKDNRAAYVHSRMDKKSTANKGVPDFIIFYQGSVIIPECKNRTGKRSNEQLGWAMLAEMNGFKVHVVRSFPEFLNIVNEKPPGD